jgi:hypothetical protein
MNGNINPATFASKRVKFFGADARLPVLFLIIWLLYKAWITFFLFIAFFIFSLILEYNNIDLFNFFKKIRMFITGKDRKKVKKTY